MRGTSKISNNNALYNITKNFTALNKVTNQTSLNRQVIYLEDDPLSANIGMRMTSAIARSNQYNRNVKAGIESLSLLDGKLGSLKTQLDSVRNIITGAANDPTTPEGRSANAVELNEILRNLVMVGNSKDGSRFIFGGQQTTSEPFTVVAGRYVNYTGNDKAINIVADNGTTYPINCTGSESFGNMITTITSRDMNPDVSLATDHSTSLNDLNGGEGVPKGKITISYSAYPNGLEVDLSGCDTLEDVKDAIEKATLEASRALDPARNAWLNGRNLDWRDLQDRYVKVTVNPEHNGISLQEFDLGEPLPQPTAAELKRGLDYSNVGGYTAGGLGIASQAHVETTVHDKPDTLYKPSSGYYAPLRVDDYAKNGVAEALGIKGTANVYNPLAGDPVMDGFIHGRDLNPVVSDRTLLADLEGYNDSVYTFTNGAKPQSTVIQEVSADSGNVFDKWNLSGLSVGVNTGPDGQLYARAVNRGTSADPEIYVELYTVPLDKAKASDLVATGVYNEKRTGGTVLLEEANNSGLSGTVGIVLPDTIKEATVSLSVDVGESFTASVHVPAFIEEQNPDGTPRDVFNIASGWSIRGLDKPPASGYDLNHPPSTDLDGNISVNYRYDEQANRLLVELTRPAFGDLPAALVATGSISLESGGYGPPLHNAVSGRIEFIGEPGFEGVKGSVYLEVPAGTTFSDASGAMGTGSGSPTSLTYRLRQDAPAGTVTFGGATELIADQNIANSASFILKGDTLFRAGQVFDMDVRLPNGGVLTAGVPLEGDLLLTRGTEIRASSLMAGTRLAEGQDGITFTNGLAAGTIIPQGSYYSTPVGTGFPAEGMAMTVVQKNPYTGQDVTTGPVEPIGFGLQATFATVEDFNRAVQEAGIYVTSGVSGDGKSLEFRSSLAGAYLTISEDTDCYEQMGDTYQQLTGLNLNGLVKGVSADKNGNAYTEVIYYPPDPLHPDKKVQLVSESGEVIEIDPGYYVRVYSDADEMKKDYANRDNTKLVAEGFIPSGQWNPAWDPTNPTATPPFLPQPPVQELGLMYGLILEERNNSGVWGTVDVDYYGGRPAMVEEQVDNPDGSVSVAYNYDPYVNDQITVYPGGLRPEGTRHTTIQDWDMQNPMPGVNCDYSGTFHGEITGNSAAVSGVDIRLYRDGSHTSLLAKTDPNEAPVNDRITLYEVDRHGNIYVDADGNRVVAGTMSVARNDLHDGMTDSFTLTTGATRNYGQEREENVFSTINDAIDALHSGDAEWLHDLIGSAQADVTRANSARGEVGSRNAYLTLLSERHADDILNYTKTYTSRVGMDDQAFAMAALSWQASTNAYQAAMQVSASIMQMSLLNYI